MVEAGRGKERVWTDDASRTYAGVLGKIIGVYLGRPVEGWSFEAIAARFGLVDRYVHAEVGVPLVVADDDISGTFAFFRTLAEHDFPAALQPAQVGATWLNQIIAERTILWWGGLGRSTEHTAFLRLQAGIPAPQSGSAALNGRTVAEQIGAQIFVDAFALACPGDPERAVALARAAASVSHDGLAVEAAVLLAALEALAFDIAGVEPLLDAALPFVREPRLLRLVEDVRTICAGETDWRRARAQIETHHGYARYGGNCPVGTNHAAVLMALLLGGDDFGRSLSIAVSAGWDTDCNAGNVGCLNGVRLGLAAIPAPLRDPVADRLLVVSALGGETISDAVRESRRIRHAAARLRGETPPTPQPRFAFEFPGAMQGWRPHPDVADLSPAPEVRLSNPAGRGLEIHYENLQVEGVVRVATPTFVEASDSGGGYTTVASPSLYPTQTVTLRVEAGARAPLLCPYVDVLDGADRPVRAEGNPTPLVPGLNLLRWTLPALEGMPIQRLGLALRHSEGAAPVGNVRLLECDWSGAPAAFEQAPSLVRQQGAPQPAWLRAWVRAARHFAADSLYTCVVSHPEPGGWVTLGGDDWSDYVVSATITFSLHRAGGLVLRHQGMRRWLAALLVGGSHVRLVCARDGVETVLAEAPFAYAEDCPYTLAFHAQGTHLHFDVNGVCLLEADTTCEGGGGAGYLVDTGTLLATGFSVRALPGVHNAG
jgi:ADP-ribosylglycohydrolase